MSAKYKVVGSKLRKFGVAMMIGKRSVIEYDLLDTREEARAICAVLNRGIGPEWDLVSAELAKSPNTKRWAESQNYQ